MSWDKPFPNVDKDIKPFWQGLQRHDFLLFRCKVCRDWYWPVTYCRKCPPQPFFGNMEWVRASGLGKVFASNIHYRAFHPGFAQDVPYVYALIELEEGPLFGSTIIGCPPQDVYVEMPVEVVYEDVRPEEGEFFDPFTLPKFRPRSSVPPDVFRIY